MSIDDQVAIMGNGNMDSQSWFHSQVEKRHFLYSKNLKYFCLIGNQYYDRFTIDSQRMDGCFIQ
jgi:hypothetical protein